MFIKVLKKNQSLWFSPQNFLKFLSNLVHFLDSHSRYAQNDSFALGPTSFEKVRKFEKIWIIPWEMVGDILSSGCINPPAFPPASFRIKRLENYLLFQRATIFINSKVLKKKTKANQSFFSKKAIIKSPIIENLI